MAATLYLSPVSLIIQYLNNLGLLAAGGQVNTYVAGSVNTPATTYTDSTGIVPNANPMTLSSAARPAAASGAPVAFWTLGGVSLKLVVTDALGNQLVNLDGIQSINDLTVNTNALQALLANPASSGGSGTGAVAGADLVANAVKSYDVFADVRAANVPALASGQTLNIEIQGGTAVGDSLGGLFYWNGTSALADDGRNVLKTTGYAGNGRWIRLFPLGVPQIIVKPGDQQVVSSTVLVNDTALTLPLAVGTYLISLRLLLLGLTATGQGWKVQPTYSAALSTPNGGGGVVSGNQVAAAVVAQVNATITQAAIATAIEDSCNLDIVVQTSAAGVLTVQFAQNANTANATVMKQGSTLSVTRLA